jgi:predicted Zn-ribbon and HTH transcriptional regulator
MKLDVNDVHELNMVVMKCKWCRHEWLPRRKVMPKVCPKCKRRTGIIIVEK